MVAHRFPRRALLLATLIAVVAGPAGAAGDVPETARTAALEWATFLGGTEDDNALEIDRDAFGNFYVVGTTDSPDFPTTPSAFQTTARGDRDGFVAKLSPDGSTLLWATYLGGTDYDEARALSASDGFGPVIVGYTYSTDFPTSAGAFDETHNGDRDIFVCRLDPTGGSLVFGTFIGGSARDGAYRVLFDESGNIVIAGFTTSANYPTTEGAYDRSYNGSIDITLTAIDGGGTEILWSTLLGGDTGEAPTGIARTPAGDFVLTGFTDSDDFPTTVSSFATPRAAFVSVVGDDGRTLVASRLLGGDREDFGTAVAAAPDGAIIVAGYTESDNFPISPVGADRTWGGGFDGFVTTLSPALDEVRWSTFVGGSEDDRLYAIHVDPNGDVTVVGSAGSADFPTTPGATDPTWNGGDDAVVCRLPSQLTTFAFATFIGGADTDVARWVGPGPGGAYLVSGHSLSENFPTTEGAAQTDLGGGTDQGDAFVLSIRQSEVVAVPETPEPVSITLAPNPARSLVSIALADAAKGVDIYDVAGRSVRHLAGEPAATDRVVTWDTRDSAGMLVPAGVYIVRPAGGGVAETVRVHVIR